MKRKLRMGMVGGGTDAFIGAIHRIAAFMDNQIELVCGCFSINPEISKSSGALYFVKPERVYSSYEEMFEKELQLPEGERMDFVTIVTPNFAHFAPAKIALENGFDVVIDKPMTFSLEEALELKSIVEKTGRTLALTHVYSAYPMVKEARERIMRGDFGKLRKIYVEYPQGWLSTRVETQGENNATWRTDPKRSGKSGCMGDIGTHAMNLAEHMSGVKCESMCADLTTYVGGRMLDDDGAALLRFEGGVKGVLMASQICAGEENAIKIRVYGEKGGIEWNQQEPNTLLVKWATKPTEILRAGTPHIGSTATSLCRTPGGHPEGFLESFANIYRNFARTVSAKRSGETPEEAWLDFPTVDDGVRGMQFIETIVESGYEENKKWVNWINK